jgi:heme exporter protein D
MTDDAAHYIFYSTLAICATVLTLVFLFVRARSRRRIPERVRHHAARLHEAGGRMPLGSRPGFRPRMILTIAGVAVMIPELLLPVVGEIVDVGIAALLAYSWYSFFKQPIALGPPPRNFPLGVDECVRCQGTGFTDGAIDPLCAGKGWVPARNQPLE